jgi:hypothetical protein
VLWGHAFYSLLFCFIELTHQLFVLIETGNIMEGAVGENTLLAAAYNMHGR